MTLQPDTFQSKKYIHNAKMAQMNLCAIFANQIGFY